jgi:hypothetical protein
MQIPIMTISQGFASENQLTAHEPTGKGTATPQELQSEYKKTERELSPLIKKKSKAFISGLSHVIRMVQINPEMKKIGNMTTLSEMLSETADWPPRNKTGPDQDKDELLGPNTTQLLVRGPSLEDQI